MQKGRHNFVTSQSEMQLFLAILFNSGYAPLPRRRLYWEPLPDVQNTAMSKAITRNRFAELMANVHVANNDSLPPDDRMAKVRPLFTALNSKFVTHFPRHQHLSIDESMVPYYGKHGAKQFIRGKPIRFGYKVWSINSSLGYCVQLDPYQGAGTSIPELGLGGSVVVKLASVLPLDNYVLYFDNFFTSLRLLHHLSVNGVKATGTVRANRIEDCPVMTVDQIKKLPRGTSDHRIDSVSNILVARWHDNSVVTLASNCHGVEPTGTVQRWSSAEKRRVELVQPYLIGKYNKYMGGVDWMDQNIATYRISIRSKKWWWPLLPTCWTSRCRMPGSSTGTPRQHVVVHWTSWSSDAMSARRTTHATVSSARLSVVQLVVQRAWMSEPQTNSEQTTLITSSSPFQHSVVVQSVESKWRNSVLSATLDYI